MLFLTKIDITYLYHVTATMTNMKPNDITKNHNNFKQKNNFYCYLLWHP